MKVLHVTLENPLVHPGGLSRYCYDLFEAQKDMGIDSYILFVGKLNNGNGKYCLKKAGNRFYRFDGSLPASLIFGVDKPERYMIPYDKEGFRSFFKENHFDVCHVHSIQGFPIEFFETAKECGVRLVYTTHDYYPFCFLYNLRCWDNAICKTSFSPKCVACSKFKALGEKTQRIRQTPLADTKLVQTAKKAFLAVKSKSKSETPDFDSSYTPSADEITSFSSLRAYHTSILKLMDVIHCNSHLTENVYRSFESNLNYKTVVITRSNLNKRKKTGCSEGGKFHVGYFGGPSVAKGVEILREAINLVVQDGHEDIVCDFYGGVFSYEDAVNCHYHGFVNGAKYAEAFRTLDLVVIPSQGYETFGYLAVESLAQGIPVIVSDLVGAKEIVESINPNAIFRYDDPEELAVKIIGLFSEDNYQNYIKAISLNLDVLDIKAHAEKIAREIYE